MKKLRYILFSALATGFVLTSCELDEQTYGGDPYLFFINESQALYIDKGKGTVDTEIDFGTMQKVGSQSTVSVTVDPTSEAKEGVDFEFINKESVVQGDEVGGAFKVKFFENKASTSAKKAVFNINSTSIKNATYNQKYTINYSLRCTMTDFAGNGDFVYKSGFWQTPGNQYKMRVDQTAKKIYIEDYPEVGTILEVDYDPVTYIAKLPRIQDTGYFHPTYKKMVVIRNTTTAGAVSTFNPCTRTLNLRVDFWMDGTGGWSNQTEVFVGK